ncbi:D-(-)-3-hydroxybutyrate oligomer hydrolase, partial [Staphylococcus capitis]|nr:D-(-)-3-hydroxybutyrate oligomer hydrolase [Staphylococcus capitis]
MPANVDTVRVNANLHGKPAIIVQGRSDALVPVNHASRAYVAQNGISEAGRSQLVFYEVTNGQHFDAFLSVPGFDTRFVPVHYYNVQALNLMWQHLKNGAPLPPSQVIRTVPRGGTPGAAPALTSANLPP